MTLIFQGNQIQQFKTRIRIQACGALPKTFLQQIINQYLIMELPVQTFLICFPSYYIIKGFSQQK